MKKIRGRMLFVLFVSIISFYLFIPSWPGLYDRIPDSVKWVLPLRGVSLGLDLQGGMHLVLEVEEDRAVELAVDRVVKSMQELLTEEDIAFVTIERVGGLQIRLELVEEDQIEETATLIREAFPSYFQTSMDSRALVVELLESEVDRIKNSAINQALETIRNRIDQFGVTEPLLQRQGRKEIVIQLPGVSDPERAKKLIQDTALLEFRMIDEENETALGLPLQVNSNEEPDILEQFADKVPEESEILFGPVSGQDGVIRPWLVHKTAAVTGDVLQDARVNYTEFNETYVGITFGSKGAKEFGRVTTDNVGKLMAIVLDDTVYSVPRISEPIHGGRAQISGNFTTDTANDLAIVLRAGALPAPMKTVQDLTVGPSLGRDSIEKGLKTTMVAGVMVLIFMVLYYRVSGLIADAALALNLLCLLGALSGLNATLTLPGIAGIILTIGMGVDSNILIFERIREELRQGRPVRLAVDAGYEKAFLTIVDSHVTTLLTGLVLFLFGAGPIKGFAVTLCLGIGINLVTALIGTKVVFDFINRRKLERLSI